jgi:two-component system C4-dicarboxylate transport sensor histidine kinase DctB
VSVATASHRRSAAVWRHWPLLLVAGGVVLVGLAARAWMHHHFELVDSNDLPMLAVADTALGAAIGLALLVVVVAHLLLDSERSRIERELAVARAALDDQAEREAQARRAGLLAALAGGLAHELGQPLSAARVGIEGLHYLRQLGREPTPEQVERTLARVGMSLLTMTQTIEHLRGLAAGSGPATLGEVDLAAIADATLADRDQWLRYHDTRIQFQRPAGGVRAMGDVAGIRLVLTNLLRNAVEAVAGQSEERRLVRLSVGPGAVVAVHDSGPGIPDAVREHLFDPFFSTKDGLMRGIGLSLAMASARRMGGDLRVVSQAGSGSTFSLILLTPEEHQSLGTGAVPS